MKKKKTRNLFMFIRLMFDITVEVWKSKAFIVSCINEGKPGEIHDDMSEEQKKIISDSMLKSMTSDGPPGHLNIVMIKSGNINKMDVFKIHLDYVLNVLVSEPKLLIPTLKTIRTTLGIMSKLHGNDILNDLVIAAFSHNHGPECNPKKPEVVN